MFATPPKTAISEGVLWAEAMSAPSSPPARGAVRFAAAKGWGEKGGRNEDKDGVKLFHAYTGNIRTCLVVNEEFFCEIAKKLHAEHNAIMEKLADIVRKK